MTDYTIKVTSDSQDAEKKLDKIDKLTEKIEKPKSIKFTIPSFTTIEKQLDGIVANYEKLEKNVVSAANNVRTFYDTTKNMPIIGEVFKPIKETEEWARKLGDTAPRIVQVAGSLKEVSTASRAVETTVKTASAASDILINRLAKVGFSLFALTQGVNLLKSAFSGMFNETIGRQIQLQETILKTQTTLASTNKVFKDGAEITDPYQKIVGLTGEIGKNIDSIRERSIELAGVTSNDVIEVFGMVAGQISQIGGGLKDAEDLAINFAAALGTFGLPLYQARQEIGSILRGDITQDSYLAKSLGITNKDIADARNRAGGIVAFLQEKLSAAVAGQKIASQGFRGVLSNIKDLQELIGQKFGAGLLNPLLTGLTEVFNTLFKIRGQIFDIAERAGRTVGNVTSNFIGQVRGRVAGSSPEGGDRIVQFADKAQDLAIKAFTEIERIANRSVGAIARIITALAPTVQNITQSVMLLAKTMVEIKVANFETLLSVIANLVQVTSTAVNTFSGLFKIYAGFLSLPIVKYFAEIGTTMSILKRAGMDLIFTTVALFTFLKSVVGPVLTMIIGLVAGIVAAIAAVVVAIGSLMISLAAVATAFIQPTVFIKGATVALNQLSLAFTNAGNQALAAGGKMNAAKAGIEGLALGAKGMAASLALSFAGAFALQLVITMVVDAFMRFQRAQEEAAADRRADLALERLSTTYKDVGDSADAATKAARDFERGLVSANFNKSIQQLEEVRNKINEIKYEMNTEGTNSVGEAWVGVRKLMALLNGTPTTDKDIQNQDLEEQEKKKADIESRISKIARTLDKERAVENIKLQADNARQLAKDQQALDKERQKIERDHKDRMFQLQQQAEGKRIDIYRTTAELEARQIEYRNKKIFEGEKGAAGAALTALQEYIATKRKGEVALEVTKRQFQMQAAELDKSVVDYRLQTEERIAALKERIGKYEMDVANYVRAQKENEAAILGASGTGSLGNMMPGGVITPGGGMFGADRRGRPGGHQGQDIGGLDAGARINARLAGTLIDILYKFGGNGNAAVVRYDSGETGTYGHINLNPGMRIGARLQAGQQIGTTSNTPGYQPHLHYELRDAAGKLVSGVLNVVQESLKVQGNSVAAAGGGAGPSNMWKFLAAVAQGESGGRNSVVNPSSGATGRFQFKDSTRTDAVARGLLTPGESAALIGDNIQAQYAAVGKYIRKLNPVAAAAIDGGDFNRAEALLGGAMVGKGGNALFTSLRGGWEAATGERRQRMDAALGGAGGIPGGAAGGFTPSPAVLNLKGLPEVQTAQYKKAVDGLKALSQQLNDIQAQLNGIDTKEKYEAVLKQLYPKRDLKQYEDALVGLRAQTQALAESTATAFDPEMMQLAVEETKTMALTDQQRLIWLRDYAKLKGISADDVARLQKDEKELHKLYLEQVKEEFRLKREILATERANNYSIELKTRISKQGQEQELALLQLRSEYAGLFRKPNDYVGARMASAELTIEQERINRRKDLTTPQAQKDFEIWANGLRRSAVELAKWDEAIAKTREKLAMVRDLTDTFTNGFKGVFRAMLSGGDIGEAAKTFSDGLADKFLTLFTDYAFKPMEQQMEKMFSKLLGVSSDPMAQNTSATADNTAAIQQLTTNISSMATGAVNNIVPGPNAGGLGFGSNLGFDYTPYTPPSGSFAGSFGGTGSSPEGGFGASGAALSLELTDLQTSATAATASVGDLSGAFGNITPAASDAIGGMQSFLGGMTSLVAGIGAIAGGVSTIGKGGTYNTLTGLAGVFGGLGGLFGGGFGGLFGGFRAVGGTALAGRSYIAGESGPELINPSMTSTVLPAGATADLFAETRAALTPMPAAAPPSPMGGGNNKLEISYQTTSLGGQNYVTEEQFREGMQQSAERGRDMAYGGIQGDPRVRNALGLR